MQHNKTIVHSPFIKLWRSRNTRKVADLQQHQNILHYSETLVNKKLKSEQSLRKVCFGRHPCKGLLGSDVSRESNLMANSNQITTTLTKKVFHRGVCSFERRKSWQELLSILRTDFLTTLAEVIIRIEWRIDFNWLINFSASSDRCQQLPLPYEWVINDNYHANELQQNDLTSYRWIETDWRRPTYTMQILYRYHDKS